MSFVDANETSLYYEVHGSGEPLVLIMGLGADSLAWALQVPAFSQQFQTITFDNRDVGRSGYVDSAYDIADMATDTLALADALGLERFHLLGMSMGGAIAQEIALRSPQRLMTLTLCATWGGGGAWARERARLWSKTAAKTPFEDHVDTLLLNCFSEAFYEDPQRVQYVRNLWLQNPNPQSMPAFCRQLEASGRHEARDRLSSLSVPVHVIGADQDVLLPLWKSRELAELIAHAELTVIEGSGHGVNLERADELNSSVLDFLSRNSERAEDAGAA